MFQLFGIDKYRIELEKVADAKNIDVRTRSNLFEVDGEKKIAKFEVLNEQSKPTGETWETEVNIFPLGPK